MLQEIFQKFNNEIVNDKCLEIEENPIVRVTDEQAQRIITKVSKCKNVSEFQKPDAVLKQKYRDKGTVLLSPNLKHFYMFLF